MTQSETLQPVRKPGVNYLLLGSSAVHEHHAPKMQLQPTQALNQWDAPRLRWGVMSEVSGQGIARVQAEFLAL